MNLSRRRSRGAREGGGITQDPPPPKKRMVCFQNNGQESPCVLSMRSGSGVPGHGLVPRVAGGGEADEPGPDVSDRGPPCGTHHSTGTLTPPKKEKTVGHPRGRNECPISCNILIRSAKGLRSEEPPPGGRSCG